MEKRSLREASLTPPTWGKKELQGFLHWDIKITTVADLGQIRSLGQSIIRGDYHSFLNTNVCQILILSSQSIDTHLTTLLVQVKENHVMRRNIEAH